MDIKTIFPEVRVSSGPANDEEWVSIEDGDQFLLFPKEQLSSRELALLEFYLSPVKKSSKKRTAWEKYLLEDGAELPERLEEGQFIYLSHQLPIPSEMVELLESIFGQPKAILSLSQTQTVFLLTRSDSFGQIALIKDILPTLENDFGLALRLFIGNHWSSLTANQLRDYFLEEGALYDAYRTQNSDETLILYSKILLWALNADHIPKAICHYYQMVLGNQKETRELVEALWDSHGNLVQTAQSLYIHRNSLQYKLDKVYRQTGLQLKQLDDLAFAYLFLQKS